MDENMDMSFSERIFIGAMKMSAVVFATAVGVALLFVGIAFFHMSVSRGASIIFFIATGVPVIALSVCCFSFVAFHIVEFARKCKEYVISDEHEDSSVELR